MSAAPVPLALAVARMSPAQRAALARVAKSRLRPFFADPRAMIALRKALQEVECNKR